MQTFTIKTTKPVFGGSCLSRINGKTVFIPYSLPDETLEISVTKEHKNYLEGKIEHILEPSPYRTEPRCKYFYRCGGCNMQMAKPHFQQQMRQKAAEEAFFRAAELNGAKACFIAGDDWEYRVRFQFHITADGLFAQKEHNSSNLIPVCDCPVAVPAIRALLQKNFDYSTDGTKKGLKNSLDYSPLFTKNGGDKKNRVHIFSAAGKVFTEANADKCAVDICGKTVRFNPLGFFQSNTAMMEKLIKTLFKEVKAEGRVLDFYAGAGTLSLFAAGTAREIHLVEHNKHALTYALSNFDKEIRCLGHKVHVFYHNIDGKNWAKSKNARLPFDIAIIDPPRSGIDKSTLNWFCTSKIPQIAYVSCNPVTFARDAASLLASGYMLKKWFLFDFYPQTHHIETLGIFYRSR